MLLTVMSVPAEVPKGLKVLVHSVVFMFHTWYQNTHTHVIVALTGRLGGMRFPYLHRPVGRSADDVVTVWGEGRLVHE